MRVPGQSDASSGVRALQVQGAWRYKFRGQGVTSSAAERASEQARYGAGTHFCVKRYGKRYRMGFCGVGLDQTRGWFYTLMVLSTALFDKPAFKNLVCNGLVLASDGKKMSKRLKNYPVRSLVPI